MEIILNKTYIYNFTEIDELPIVIKISKDIMEFKYGKYIKIGYNISEYNDFFDNPFLSNMVDNKYGEMILQRRSINKLGKPRIYFKIDYHEDEAYGLIIFRENDDCEFIKFNNIMLIQYIIGKVEYNNYLNSIINFFIY
jgi:hypothetical protein